MTFKFDSNCRTITGRLQTVNYIEFFLLFNRIFKLHLFYISSCNTLSSSYVSERQYFIESTKTNTPFTWSTLQTLFALFVMILRGTLSIYIFIISSLLSWYLCNLLLWIFKYLNFGKLWILYLFQSCFTISIFTWSSLVGIIPITAYSHQLSPL